MAAIRFKAEFDSFSGDRYNIEIWDRDHVGGVTEFFVDRSGFSLTAEATDRISTIQGTSCDIVMYIQNATHEALITDLLSSEEGRFLINITTGATSPQPYWRGVLLPDIGSFEEAHYPYQLKLSATDGIAALKEIKYKNGNLPYTGKQSALKHILNCLNKIRTVDVLWGSSDNFISVYVDWWETTHTHTSSSQCPLNQTYIDHSIFYKEDEGIQDYLTCYEVIENILTVFGARITFGVGSYWIEQITYRTAATIIGRGYTKSGTFISAGNFSALNTIDQTSGGALEAVANYEFLPALKEHRHTFKSFQRANRLDGIADFTDANFANVTVNKPIDSEGGSAFLRFAADFTLAISSTTAPGTAFEPFVALYQIKLKVGSYYARRTYTLTSAYQIEYSDVEWLTGVSYIYLAVPITNGFFLGNTTGSTFTFTQQVDILTQNLIDDADNFDIEIQFIRFEKYDTTTYTSTLFDFAYQFADMNLLIYPQLDEDERRYICENTLFPNNSVVSKTQSLIGTSPYKNTLGALWVKPSTDYQLATLWGDGVDTPNAFIEYLLCEFIVSGQAKPIRKLQGTLFGNLSKMARIYWKGAYWILLRGTWIANEDQFVGEWFELSYNEGLSTSPPQTIKVKQIGVQIPTLPPATTNAGASYEMVAKPPGTLFNPLSLTTTDALALSPGPITTIPTAEAMVAGDLYAGDTLAILNPITGAFDELTVTANVTTGATSIAVSGTLSGTYPKNSLLIKKPKIGSFSLPTGAVGDLLYFDGTTWTVLNKGTANQYLKVNSAGSDLEYVTLTLTSGTVTSVGLSLPAIFSVSGSPVTSSGTLTAALATQAANTIFAGPSSGVAAAPTFRALVADDIPNLDAAKITTGFFAIARGGTGLTALGTALQVLRVNSAGTALEYATLSIPSGTVTSVGLSLPSIFTVSGSPVTSSGTLTGSLATQTANQVFAGPTTGAAASPTFRALVVDDIPSIPTSKLSQSSAANGQYLSWNGTAWVPTTLAGIIGTLVSGRVPVADGTGSLTTDDSFLFDTALNRLTIGATSHGGYLYNLLGPTQSSVLQIFDLSATINGSNLYAQIKNNSNLNSSSNTLFNIQVGGTNAGDPVIQWQVPGSGGTTWSAGIDNSDSDKFRIIDASSPSNTGQGITITTNGKLGINNDDPFVTLDLDNNTDGILLPNGTSSQRPLVAGLPTAWILRGNTSWVGLEWTGTSGNVFQLTSDKVPVTSQLTWYSGAGTTAATSVSFNTDSNQLNYEIVFTTTSSPAANSDVFKFTFNISGVVPTRTGRVFITPRSFTAASTSLQWWVSAQNQDNYTIAVAGTLAASTIYRLNIMVVY